MSILKLLSLLVTGLLAVVWTGLFVNGALALGLLAINLLVAFKWRSIRSFVKTGFVLQNVALCLTGISGLWVLTVQKLAEQGHTPDTLDRVIILGSSLAGLLLLVVMTGWVAKQKDRSPLWGALGAVALLGYGIVLGMKDGPNARQG